MTEAAEPLPGPAGRPLKHSTHPAEPSDRDTGVFHAKPLRALGVVQRRMTDL